MKIPTGTRKFDNEKRDRAMARAILDKLGLEPEKYRLGYTKVGSESGLAFAKGLLIILGSFLRGAVTA